MNVALPDRSLLDRTLGNRAAEPPVVERVGASWWSAAADLLASHLPDGVREEHREAIHRLLTTDATAHLWIARRAQTLVGAVLGQPAPGRVALVYPPQVIVGEPLATAATLHDALVESLARSRVELLQASLHPQDLRTADWLDRQRYVYIADLLYLLAPVPASPPHTDASDLEFVPCPPDANERLAAVVEATYEATLDCPRLDGWRATADVLDGYRATGEYDPSRWLIVRHQGQDVGCLLLTEHGESGHWELLYMGLARPYRGRGWGLRLVERALQEVRRAGRQQLVLAVDRQNHPALRVYRRSGFVPWARRKVLARRLADRTLVTVSANHVSVEQLLESEQKSLPH